MTVIDIMQRVRILPNIDIIKRYQHREHEDMVEQKSDRLTVISGYEGSGKSYLEMDLFENWYKNVLKVKITAEIAKLFCHTDVDWAKGLQYIKDKPYYRLSHDEAVNIIYAKDAITKKNKAINKAFKKIRGKRIYHSMLIPQVHRIDKELREDRVRMLLFVFKHKGKRFVAIYPKSRLDVLAAELNRMIQSTAKDVRTRPNVLNCETMPSFVCKIPIYKGELLDKYSIGKEDNMDASIEEIADVVMPGNAKRGKAIIDAGEQIAVGYRINQLREAKTTWERIAKFIGKSRQQCRNIHKKYISDQKSTKSPVKF